MAVAAEVIVPNGMVVPVVLAVGFVAPTYKDLIAFVVLILVLLIRPTGLLGARVQQKV